MSNNPTGSTTPAATAEGQGASASPENAASAGLEAAVNALRGQIATLTSGYTGLRSLMDRRFAQLSGARGDQVNDGGDGAGAQRGATDIDPDELEDMRRDNGIGRFLNLHPEARELWNEVLKIVQDNSMTPVITAYTPNGKIDYYKSYRNALREVQIARYEAAKAAASDVAAASQRDNATARAQAATSGGGNESADTSQAGNIPTLEELEAMDPAKAAELIEKHGLKQYFPGLTG